MDVTDAALILASKRNYVKLKSLVKREANMLEIINAWLEHWYPLCWSIVFTIEMSVGIAILSMAIKEYRYDESKDLEKKQRKTRTTKKVTEQKDGAKVTEETTETSEPVKEENNGHNN
jgi:hypothetical protein